MMSSNETTDRPKTVRQEKTVEKPKKPSMYAVVLHNDPFTPRSFVVEVLRLVFQKDETQATTIMLSAHRGNYAIVEIYSREVAEMKSNQANHYSAAQGRMLLFSVEKQ